MCLVPDELDDAWCLDAGQRTEFYGMSGFVYGGQFLGFLPVFDVIKDARGESGMPASVAADGSKGLHAPAVISESGAEIDQAPWDGPIAAQLVHSRDGLSWHRFEDRSPIIPRGEPGSFGRRLYLCSADRPLIRGDEVWHYYTAVSTMHGGPMPPKTISIGLAKWRLDGFVSLDAGHFRWGKWRRCRCGFRARAGGQCGCKGRQLGGGGAVGRWRASARIHSRGLPGDRYRRRTPIRALGRGRAPSDRAALRLRFHLQDAELYSFRIREAGQP